MNGVEIWNSKVLRRFFIVRVMGRFCEEIGGLSLAQTIKVLISGSGLSLLGTLDDSVSLSASSNFLIVLEG